MTSRNAFACVYLAGYLLAEFGYVLLTPHAQTALTAWASTNVANLEHEPIGPLTGSAFIGPGCYVVWPVLIALAVFGANRALGAARTAAALTFAVLTFGGHIFGGLSHAGVPAVGHLTALLTVAAAVAVILAERARRARSRTPSRRASGDLIDQDADQVGDPGGAGPEEELA